MFRDLLAGVLMSMALLGMAGSAHAQDTEAEAAAIWSTGEPGLFCYVESQGVCVITRNDEDCTKLGGEKADSCPITDKDDGK